MSLHIPIQTHGQYISNKPDIVIRDMNDSGAHGFGHPVESNTSVEVAEKLSKYKDRQGLGTKTETHQW